MLLPGSHSSFVTPTRCCRADATRPGTELRRRSARSRRTPASPSYCVWPNSRRIIGRSSRRSSSIATDLTSRTELAWPVTSLPVPQLPNLFNRAHSRSRYAADVAVERKAPSSRPGLLTTLAQHNRRAQSSRELLICSLDPRGRRSSGVDPARCRSNPKPYSPRRWPKPMRQ